MLIIDGHTHITDPIELMLKKMERLDIDKSIICGSGLAQGEKVSNLKDAKEMMNNISNARKNYNFLSFSNIENENKKIARKIKEYPDKLFGFGKINLSLPENLLKKQINQINNLGLNGIGEIIGITNHLQKLEKLISLNSAKKKLPLFIHCDYPVTKNEINKIIIFSKEWEDVPIILGHTGGDFWIEAIKGAKEASNIYLDLSEVINLVAAKVTVKEVPGRVIFGSDFPWEDPKVSLTRINELSLDESTLKKIFSENILRIVK